MGRGVEKKSFDSPNLAALLLLSSSGKIQIVPEMSVGEVLTARGGLLRLPQTGQLTHWKLVVSQSGGWKSEIKV